MFYEEANLVPCDLFVGAFFPIISENRVLNSNGLTIFWQD